MILLFPRALLTVPLKVFSMYQKTIKTFDAFYRKYEDVFNVDCKEWTNEEKVRLLLRKLGTSEHCKFVDFISPPKNNGSGVLRDS